MLDQQKKEYMKFIIIVTIILASQLLAADFSSIIKEGIALHDKGMFSEAIKKYKEAELIDNSNATLKYELCFSSYANKDYVNAIKYCKKSIELKPFENSGAYVQLGTIYDEQGKPDSATLIYEEGLKKDPSSYMLKYNLAITMFNLKKIEKAYEYAKSATTNTKVHEGSYYVAGYLAHQQGLWLDEYAYTMYSLMIGKSSQRMQESVNRIYSLNKSLATRGGVDSVKISIPSTTGSNAVDLNQAFIMAVALSIVSDSTGGVPLYSEKISSYDYLVSSSIAAIKMIAEMDSKNTLKPFYAEIVKNKFEEAFARYAYSNVSSNEYKIWKKRNENIMNKFNSWLSESYFKN